MIRCLFFFFNDTATTEIYTYGHTLSLHDALPISVGEHAGRIGRRTMALRLNENGPAGAEAPEGVVETAGDSDQLSRHGAVEVGPAEACGALQAAVLVEDNAFADQCDPGEEEIGRAHV